ncbi:MAG: NAD(+) synthase [Spirochaetes bacterium]|nr:NAD(+) synthase [Spirochaetota bacterium]
MKIAIAQGIPFYLDIDKNCQLINKFIEIANKENSQLLIFPQYFMTGYDPGDLTLYSVFKEKIENSISRILSYSRNFENLYIILPLPFCYQGCKFKDSVLIIKNGEIKQKLNENSFVKIDNFQIFLILNKTLNIDLESFFRETKQSFIVNLLPIPYNYYKDNDIKKFIESIKKYVSEIYIQCSIGGVFDQNVFDCETNFYIKEENKIIVTPYLDEGLSFYNPEGKNIEFIKLSNLEEKISLSSEYYVNFERFGNISKFPEFDEEILFKLHNLMIFSVKNYVNNSGFNKVCVGLSGGIDSALVGYIATKAFGPENVYSYTLPSPFSSEGSFKDSFNLASNLGIKCDKININTIYETYLNELNPYFLGKPFDVTEENIQARIRANILMAFSNKFGYFLLNTSNKSEVATGYGTMYGDITGGVCVLGDIYKTLVYKLANFINNDYEFIEAHIKNKRFFNISEIIKEKKEIIPENIIKKAPSAELRHGQKDQDSLPPYDILDLIIYYFLEENKDHEEIISMGFDRETVMYTIKLIFKNEYKRKQAPPLLKFSRKSFGSDRNFPLNSFYYNIFLS